MCCVSAVMTNPKKGTQDTLYRCMNYRVANSGFDVAIGNTQVTMKCTESFAAYMKTAFLASFVSLIAMIMY